MEIKPGKSGYFKAFAEVRVDSFEEMYSLGANAPLLSREGQRWHTYMSHGILPFGGRFPESFPTRLQVNERVLARVAGNLMLFNGDSRPQFREAKQHMLQEITGYFSHTSPSEISRLSSLGMRMVRGYKENKQPEQS